MKKTNIIIIALILLSSHLFAQNINITGKVVDKENEPIIGASVKLEGTTIGGLTDINGNFKLSIPDKNGNLVISYVGLETATLPLKNQPNHIEVKLLENTKLLDEVVIVGFGTQKKINATGAVKTIGGEILESRPISNAVQGLQGVIPGLNISTDNGGALGQEMNINIRGLGSIGEGSTAQPLVLIDGMEGSLSSLNPNDIESYSVLKDGASASIYGSRAPFGVILVTTKSGSSGKITANYTSNLRLSTPINVPKMVDSYQYALAINDAYFNSGGNPPYSATLLEKILKFQRGEYTTAPEKYGLETRPIIVDGQIVGYDWAWDSFANTDWYKVHIKDLYASQEHNLSFRGGSENLNFFLSGNYLDQDGMFTFAHEKYKRFTLNGKLTFKIKKNMDLTWTSRLINTKNDRPTAMTGLGNLFYHNLGRRNPLSPVVMPNGEYSSQSMIQSLQDGGKHINQNQIFYNQVQYVYEPIKKWRFYADIGSRIEKPEESRQFKKIYTTRPDGTVQYLAVYEGITQRNDVNKDGTFRRWPAAGETFYERAFGNTNYYSTSFRTDYEHNIGDHNFKYLIGTQTEYSFSEMLRTASDNIVIDKTPFLPSGSGTNPRMSEKLGEWANFGVFGRINYNYADKYMVEVNVRADGASRFPPLQKFGIFPSFSLGWNVMEESFASTLKAKGFDMLKPRFSYSNLGNQNTQSFYPYYQYMSINTSNLVFDGATVNVLPAPEPFPKKITWETIENIDLGVDMAFMNNRLAMTFDLFQRTTKNMVGPANELPAVFGAPVPKTNNAELRTRGWELELTWRENVNKDFRYDITGTLSDLQTIVMKYDSPDKNINKFYEGKTLGDIWGYSVIGIAKSDKEMNEYLAQHSQSELGQNWGGGDFMYRNLDGDPKISAGAKTLTNHGDLRVIGNSTPRFAFGVRFNTTYKIFDASIFLQGIGKRDVSLTDLYGSGQSATFLGVASEWQRSLYAQHLDYFRFVGDPLGANMDAYYPRLRFDSNNHYASDYYLQNGAYLRVKNVQIGVSLPDKHFASKWISKGRFYLSVENLLTFTKLKIFDPEAALGNEFSEMGVGKTYPMSRVFAAGLEVNF